jgi:hypothetical protein
VVTGTLIILVGCVAILPGTSNTLVIDYGATFTIAARTIIYGGSITVAGWLGIDAISGGYAAWLGTTGGGVINSTTDGVIINPGGVLYTRQLLFGSGGAGYGIRVKSGGLATYTTKPTLTGASNDTIIGGTATAYASIPFVNTTNQAMLVLLA